MSRFIPVELHHASRLLNHGPTVLITSFDEQSQRRNIMAAAWSMPVEFEPPRVAIVVDKSTWTRELIERNGKFGIVILVLQQLTGRGRWEVCRGVMKISLIAMVFRL